MLDIVVGIFIFALLGMALLGSLLYKKTRLAKYAYLEGYDKGAKDTLDMVGKEMRRVGVKPWGQT